MSVYIIAEAGVNHNGNFDLAIELIDAAKKAGADCIKFQTFKSEEIVSKNAEKAEYQKKTTGNSSQKDMLKKLELTFDEFERLKLYCDKIGIAFCSTAFDFQSVDFLNKLDIPFWKIPSGEITNLPYLERVAATGKPVIISTGMCDMDEIDHAVQILSAGGIKDIKILHCNTEYPTPYEDVNLRAMQAIKDRFGVEVGYSDHTDGIEISVAAVALGAAVIEKHFTLNKGMEGPDHKASLEPWELEKLVRAIRNIEKALGNGEKVPSNSEKKNKNAARKSIVAKQNIKCGEIFTKDNLTVKRPGYGISPMRWYEILGKKSNREYQIDDLIQEEEIWWQDEGK